MKTHLLTVPSKKTEEINWVKPLNNYLVSIYGNTSSYQDDLNSFNKLRQDIRGVNADNTGLKLYYKYYSQLELLDLRIPFATVNKHKKLEFEWFDAFSPTVANKQAALPFEKANVLFNLAALLTRFAKHKYDKSIQDSGSEGVDDATKSTIQLLQSAAGVYQFINENFLHAPSDDLSQSTVKFLCKLMLAESQEVFTLKVITNDVGQKKNSLISKLCKSTSTFYEDCYNMISKRKKQGYNYYDDDDDNESDSYDYAEPQKPEQDDVDAYVTADLDDSWISTIFMKYLYYNSLAYYFHGLNLETNRKYGDAIAYFNKSKEIIKEIHSPTLQAISKGTGDVYEILDNYKYQKDALDIKLNDLNKDNDLIYHDIVPSLVTIPDIKPMDSTKIIPINQHTILQEINEQNYNNFLTNVVPVNIHELSSFYSEEKSQFLRNEMDLVDVSNEEVESVLEYLKLPKSLIEIKEMFNFAQEGTEIPSETKDKVAEIASNYNQDAQTKSSIESLRRQILETISACDSKLSGSFSNKDELIQLKKVLYDATNSDQKLFSLIDPSFYSILSKGPDSTEFTGLFEGQDQIKQAAPEVSLLDIDDSKQDLDVVSSNIKRLENILHDIHMAKSQKMKLMKKLKTEIHNDDISDILILNSKLKSSNEIKTVIFPEELKKFNPYNEELDKLVTKEKSFINDLKSNWNNLVTNPQVKNMTKNRVSLDKKVSESTGRIIEFYENWKKYHAGLAKGQKFYQDLLNHASKVKNDIEMGIKMNEGFKNLNVGAPTGGQQQYQQFTGGSQEGYRQQVASPQSPGHNYQQYTSPQSTGQNYQQYASPQSTGPSYQQPPTAQQFPPQPMVNRHDSYSAQYPSQQQPQPLQYQPAQAQTQPPQYQSQYQPQPQSQYQSPPPLVNRGSTDASGFGYQHRQNQVPPQQPPVLNKPSTFESNPSMTYTPPIQPGQYGQAPPPQGYSRPPQLPPKQPSYSQPSAPKPPVPPQVPSQAQPPPQQQQPSGQVPWNQNEANKSNNSLIYDQPSTYNPNMYNFFSSN